MAAPVQTPAVAATPAPAPAAAAAAAPAVLIYEEESISMVRIAHRCGVSSCSASTRPPCLSAWSRALVANLRATNTLADWFIRSFKCTYARMCVCVCVTGGEARRTRPLQATPPRHRGHLIDSLLPQWQQRIPLPAVGIVARFLSMLFVLVLERTRGELERSRE